MISLLIYLVDCVKSIQLFCFVFLTSVPFIILCIGSDSGSDVYEFINKHSKHLKKVSVVYIIVAMISISIPSKKVIMEILNQYKQQCIYDVKSKEKNND